MMGTEDSSKLKDIRINGTLMNVSIKLATGRHLIEGTLYSIIVTFI